MSDGVLLEQRIGDAVMLSLNRIERLNALNGELMDALLEATHRVTADSSVRAVMLTGEGKAFCAGGDVKEGSQRREAATPSSELQRDPFDEQVNQRHARMQGATCLREMHKPTVAVLRGAVMGAGMSLALACDLRIASETMVMRTAFAGAALSGDYGIGYFLSRSVGASRALEMLLLSEKIPAEQALALGLVNRVVPDDQLDREGQRLVERLAGGPTVAYGGIKANM